MKALLAALVVVTIAALVPSRARALELSYSTLGPFGSRQAHVESLLLRGKIVRGDRAKLLAFIAKDQERFWRTGPSIILASRGGDVEEALKLANLVKHLHAVVWVGPAHGPCVSACFLIYVAADRHQAGGYHSVGIHRPYVDPRRLQSMDPRDAENAQEWITRKVRRYLQNASVPDNLIDAMFERASTEIYWLSDRELDLEIGLYSPWYEQFLIARCGLNAALEKRYFSGREPPYRRREDIHELVKAESCGQDLTTAEGRAYLKKALGAQRHVGR